ncbi:MAG: hypothetical protein MUF34_33815 [Polyangiaceae bacterium]|nr:hypothetical protein [Polyangiaceae bacterium]
MSASSSTPPPADPPRSSAPPPSAPSPASPAPVSPSSAGPAPSPVPASSTPIPTSEGPDPDADPSADVLRAILRKAPPPPPPRVDVLRGVQERLRVRSRGKFYADGWSTRDEEPRATYLVTALFMLVVAVALYLALSPGAAGGLP